MFPCLTLIFTATTYSIILGQDIGGTIENQAPVVTEPREQSVCPYAYQPDASFCPEMSELYQDNDNIWQSKSGWKANEPSFSSTLKKFVGVQWKGVNIGLVRKSFLYLSIKTSSLTTPQTSQTTAKDWQVMPKKRIFISKMAVIKA